MIDKSSHGSDAKSLPMSARMSTFGSKVSEDAVEGAALLPRNMGKLKKKLENLTRSGLFKIVGLARQLDGKMLACQQCANNAEVTDVDTSSLQEAKSYSKRVELKDGGLREDDAKVDSQLTLLVMFEGSSRDVQKKALEGIYIKIQDEELMGTDVVTVDVENEERPQWQKASELNGAEPDVKHIIQYWENKREDFEPGWHFLHPKDQSSRIFVGHLPDTLTEDALREEFAKYGDITEIYFPKNFNTKTSNRQWAYITYETVDRAFVAKEIADGKLKFPDSDINVLVKRSAVPLAYNPPKCLRSMKNRACAANCSQAKVEGDPKSAWLMPDQYLPGRNCPYCRWVFDEKGAPVYVKSSKISVLPPVVGWRFPSPVPSPPHEYSLKFEENYTQYKFGVEDANFRMKTKKDLMKYHVYFKTEVASRKFGHLDLEGEYWESGVNEQRPMFVKRFGPDGKKCTTEPANWLLYWREKSTQEEAWCLGTERMLARCEATDYLPPRSGWNVCTDMDNFQLEEELDIVDESTPRRRWLEISEPDLLLQVCRQCREFVAKGSETVTLSSLDGLWLAGEPYSIIEVKKFVPTSQVEANNPEFQTCVIRARSVKQPVTVMIIPLGIYIVIGVCMDLAISDFVNHTSPEVNASEAVVDFLLDEVLKLHGPEMVEDYQSMRKDGTLPTNEKTVQQIMRDMRKQHGPQKYYELQDRNLQTARHAAATQAIMHDMIEMYEDLDGVNKKLDQIFQQEPEKWNSRFEKMFKPMHKENYELAKLRIKRFASYLHQREAYLKTAEQDSQGLWGLDIYKEADAHKYMNRKLMGSYKRMDEPTYWHWDGTPAYVWEKKTEADGSAVVDNRIIWFYEGDVEGEGLGMRLKKDSRQSLEVVIHMGVEKSRFARMHLEGLYVLKDRTRGPKETGTGKATHWVKEYEPDGSPAIEPRVLWYFDGDPLKGTFGMNLRKEEYEVGDGVIVKNDSGSKVGTIMGVAENNSFSIQFPQQKEPLKAPSANLKSKARGWFIGQSIYSDKKMEELTTPLLFFDDVDKDTPPWQTKWSVVDENRTITRKPIPLEIRDEDPYEMHDQVMVRSKNGQWRIGTISAKVNEDRIYRVLVGDGSFIRAKAKDLKLHARGWFIGTKIYEDEAKGKMVKQLGWCSVEEPTPPKAANWKMIDKDFYRFHKGSVDIRIETEEHLEAEALQKFFNQAWCLADFARESDRLTALDDITNPLAVFLPGDRIWGLRGTDWHEGSVSEKLDDEMYQVKWDDRSKDCTVREKLQLRSQPRFRVDPYDCTITLKSWVTKRWASESYWIDSCVDVRDWWANLCKVNELKVEGNDMVTYGQYCEHWIEKETSQVIDYFWESLPPAVLVVSHRDGDHICAGEYVWKGVANDRPTWLKTSEAKMSDTNDRTSEAKMSDTNDRKVGYRMQLFYHVDAENGTSGWYFEGWTKGKPSHPASCLSSTADLPPTRGWRLPWDGNPESGFSVTSKEGDPIFLVAEVEAEVKKQWARQLEYEKARLDEKVDDETTQESTLVPDDVLKSQLAGPNTPSDKDTGPTPKTKTKTGKSKKAKEKGPKKNT